MRKNEIIKELDNKIEFIRKQEGYTEAYQVGIIRGLEIAKESIKGFKRR